MLADVSFSPYCFFFFFFILIFFSFLPRDWRLFPMRDENFLFRLMRVVLSRIGGFLQLFVYRLYSLLSFLKAFELINSEGLQNNQLINKNLTPSLLAPLCFDSPCI